METKKFTRKEIAEKDPRAQNVFIINNIVYDVTKFLDEHPGGHEVLVNVTGKDASEDFEDVGHSFEAKEMMKKYEIGEIVEEDRVEVKKRHAAWGDEVRTADEPSFVSSWKFPLVLGLVMTVLYSYLFG